MEGEGREGVEMRVGREAARERGTKERRDKQSKLLLRKLFVNLEL